MADTRVSSLGRWKDRALAAEGETERESNNLRTLASTLREAAEATKNNEWASWHKLRNLMIYNYPTIIAGLEHAASAKNNTAKAWDEGWRVGYDLSDDEWRAAQYGGPNPDRAAAERNPYR